MSEPTAKRPFIISLIGIVMYLQAVLLIVFGALFIALRDNEDVLGATDISSSTLLALGIAMAAVGLVLFLVARGLRHGSRAARNLVALAELLAIAGAVAAIVTHAAGASISSGAGTIVGALIVLWALFGHDASKRYFAA